MGDPVDLEGLLARVLKIPRAEIGADARQGSLPRWDSVTHVELITALEAAYGVSFTIPEIVGMDSLQAIRERLRAKGRLA